MGENVALKQWPTELCIKENPAHPLPQVRLIGKHLQCLFSGKTLPVYSGDELTLNFAIFTNF